MTLRDACYWCNSKAYSILLEGLLVRAQRPLVSRIVVDYVEVWAAATDMLCGSSLCQYNIASLTESQLVITGVLLTSDNSYLLLSLVWTVTSYVNQTVPQHVTNSSLQFRLIILTIAIRLSELPSKLYTSLMIIDVANI